MARTWATVYGSAWVEASDLIEYPGPLVGWPMLEIRRALHRSGVIYETRAIHRQRLLYRLSPDTVAQLLYGGSDDSDYLPSSR